MARLSVVQAMHRLKDGTIVFTEPKSARSRRAIPLTPTSALALRAYRDRQEAERVLLGASLTVGDLVFSHADGSPLLPSSISRVFKRAVDRLGLHGVRFLDLRHADATILLRQNTHPKIIQERLGHSTISITLDTYSHALPGLQEAAALRFDEALQGRRSLIPSATFR